MNYPGSVKNASDENKVEKRGPEAVGRPDAKLIRRRPFFISKKCVKRSDLRHLKGRSSECATVIFPALRIDIFGFADILLGKENKMPKARRTITLSDSKREYEYPARLWDEKCKLLSGKEIEFQTFAESFGFGDWLRKEYPDLIGRMTEENASRVASVVDKILLQLIIADKIETVQVEPVEGNAMSEEEYMRLVYPGMNEYYKK
jgi:hypothetical protein